MQRHILTVLFAVFLTTSFFFQPTPAHACSWTQKLVPYSVLALLTLAVLAAIWLAFRRKRGRS